MPAPAAGKVKVGLASHWPCRYASRTLVESLPTYWLAACGREMSTLPAHRALPYLYVALVAASGRHSAAGN